MDFGVYMTFPTGFKDCMPDTAVGATGIAAGLRMCAKGYTAGQISYPSLGSVGAKQGTLIVLKAALTTDLPVDVLRYAASHPDFPNESTADQFFSERQFEAYRETGYAACRDMLKAGALDACRVGRMSRDEEPQPTLTETRT